MKPGLNHEDNLFEQVDEIEGIENKEFARLKKKVQNSENADAKSIAVIGFWKLNNSHNFRCYHSFIVPNPMMRQTLEVEETVLNQVLYVGNMHDDAPAGEVFMFFREKV